MRTKIRFVMPILLAAALFTASFAYDAQAIAPTAIDERASDTSFVMRPDGSLWGWGNNEFGQLGDGTRINRHSPVHIIDNVVDFSSNGTRSLAVTADGGLWSWGTVPTRVMDDVIAVSAGDEHTMIIKTDGSLWGWGNNSRGQLGVITSESHTRENPVHIMDDVIAVSAGSNHTLAITADGGLWAWGWSNRGQVQGDHTVREWGSNPDLMHPEPIQIRYWSAFIAISAGHSHSMAVSDDGRLWVWGSSSSGQIGDGRTSNRRFPVNYIMDDVVAISAGRFHSAAITSDGALWTWGSNQNGQIGNGLPNEDHGRATRVPVHVMDDVSSVYAGYANTLVIKTDGSVWAWGSNRSGQIGDGTATITSWVFDDDQPFPNYVVHEDNTRRSPVHIMDAMAE